METLLLLISALAPFGIGIVGIFYGKILPQASPERKRFMRVGGICLMLFWAGVLFKHLTASPRL